MYDPIDKLDLQMETIQVINKFTKQIDSVLPIGIGKMGRIFGDNLVMDFFIERRLDNYTIIINE